MSGRREPGTTLRVVVADDERPARAFLLAMLRGTPDVEVVGEAADGAEAVALIERTRPDLALLDLQMPEVDGLGVVRLLRRDALPLVAFVTAYDQYAVQAFELNAVDYLLKPVDAVRLRQTLVRAQERLERADLRETEQAAGAARAVAAAAQVEAWQAEGGTLAPLTRIPVRRRDDVILVPVTQVLSVVADGELLQLTTASGDRHTITYRLKDLEARLAPGTFLRLSRGALVRLDAIAKVSPMPGGTYLVTLTSGAQLPVSRLRSRIVRDQLLRL
jgi:two-component system LytT family response regulator